LTEKVCAPLVYYDLQAESSGWLFKAPLAQGVGILWRPH